MSPKPNRTSEGGSTKKNKPRPPSVKFILTVLKILTIFVIAIGCAGVGIIGGAMYGFISTATPITPEDLNLSDNLTTIIYDRTGQHEIARLTGFDNTDRMLVFDRDGQIPQYLKDAFVAIEDERFYDHKGVDIKRTMAAALNLIWPRGGTFGGSTITQQVVKNITGEKDVSLKRKIQEQWRAIQLERKYEKWQILELYMNLIYMGNSCYGVQSASYKYFGKPVKDLSLAEAASLAGITNSPADYDPFTEKGRENNKKRQELILGKMLELGFITQTEYDQAMKEELKFADKNEVKIQTTKVRSYFVDQVIYDVLKDLEATGLDREFAKLKLYSGGLKIITTVDLEIQNAMDEVFMDAENFPGGIKQGLSPQAAMVVINPHSGEVLAMYGGSGEKKADMVLNRATQTKRSPGSSFKPIAVYAPAIDQRIITAGTIVDDVPVYMDTQNKDRRYPENYPETIGGKTARHYRGLVSIRTAIARSINVVAAKIWRDQLGPDLSFEYLKKSGIEMKGEGKYVSVSLGGLRYGVSPMQMAAAYAPFVHKGIYLEPITYSIVKDNEGNILLDKRKTANIKQKRNIVYDETTAFIMADLLKSVTASGGTASYVKLKSSTGKPIPTLGKTGTTNDDVDRWFLGATSDFVGSVWYGYDKQITVKLPSNSRNPAANIWMKVMQKIYDAKKLEAKDFSVPQGLVKKKVCAYSGKIATDLCAKDPRGSAVREEYFIKGTEPKDSDICDIHIEAMVDINSKDLYGRPLLANEYCPVSDVVKKVFIQRKVPYMPIKPDDPYPLDWQYEVPIEYCNLHGAPIVDPSVQHVPEGDAGEFTPDDQGREEEVLEEDGGFLDRLGDLFRRNEKPEKDKNENND